MPVVSLTTVEILDEVRAYVHQVLADRAIELTRQHTDHRSESLQNEAEIRQMLRTFAVTPRGYFRTNGLTLVEPQVEGGSRGRDPTGWFDFAIEGPNVFIPVNIKVTNLASRNADNLNCKLGLYYALTGHRPDFGNAIGFEALMRKMVERMSEDTNADYYFLVINKAQAGDVFWNSLKGLNHLSANGRNPPFQGRWADNRLFVARSNGEARRFLLGKLRESLRQAAKPFMAFEELLLPYLEG
jgi:hypothetical protein